METYQEIIKTNEKIKLLSDLEQMLVAPGALDRISMYERESRIAPDSAVGVVIGKIKQTYQRSLASI